MNTKSGLRTLVVDDEYLQSIHKGSKDPNRCLDEDLKDVDVVHLKLPTSRIAAALYPDVRAYISAMAVKQGYTIRVSGGYDASMIRAVLGPKNVVGNPEEGYRFQKAS